jgi:hypothetical protein
MPIGIVLTEEKAVDIYKCKINQSELALRGLSVPVSQAFAVSPKTVRDIWSGRTWAYATCELWTDEVRPYPMSYFGLRSKSDDQLMGVGFQAKSCRPAIIRRPGRPRGSKNSKQSHINGQEQVVEKMDPVIWLEGEFKAPSPEQQSAPTVQVTTKPNANPQTQMLDDLAQADSSKYFRIPGEATIQSKVQSEKSAILNDPFHFDWPFW